MKHPNRIMAAEQGLKTYQGNPCKRGHLERYVLSNNCVKCKLKCNKEYIEIGNNRANRKAYMRKWNQENVDYANRYSKAYRQKKIDEARFIAEHLWMQLSKYYNS